MEAKDPIVAQSGVLARVVAVVREAAGPRVHPVEPCTRSNPQNSIGVLVDGKHLLPAQAPVVSGVMPVVRERVPPRPVGRAPRSSRSRGCPRDLCRRSRADQRSGWPDRWAHAGNAWAVVPVPVVALIPVVRRYPSYRYKPVVVASHRKPWSSCVTFKIRLRGPHR